MSDQSKASLDDFHRITAATCNNRAWDLIETIELDDVGRMELVTLATVARYHWNFVGKESNKAAADLLFGWASARAGRAEDALTAARRSLDYFQTQDVLPFEIAIAHAAMAAACLCAQDLRAYEEHYRAAEALMASMKPEGLKIFEASFRTLPEPE